MNIAAVDVNISGNVHVAFGLFIGLIYKLLLIMCILVYGQFHPLLPLLLIPFMNEAN